MRMRVDVARQDAEFVGWGFGEFSGIYPACDDPVMHPAAVLDPTRPARERLAAAAAHHHFSPFDPGRAKFHVVVCQLPAVADILNFDRSDDTVDQCALFVRIRAYNHRCVAVPGCTQASCVPAWEAAAARLASPLPPAAAARFLEHVGSLPPTDEWMAALGHGY